MVNAPAGSRLHFTLPLADDHEDGVTQQLKSVTRPVPPGLQQAHQRVVISPVDGDTQLVTVPTTIHHSILRQPARERPEAHHPREHESRTPCPATTCSRCRAARPWCSSS